MRIYPLLMSAAALGALATVSSAATGATGAPAKKQRIAVTGTFMTGTGTGTFKLTPLTPGPLKPDSGTFSGTGDIRPTVVRNGQSVTVITGHDEHTGKHGGFIISQRVESVSAGGGYSVDTGLWSLSEGTGQYAGLTGSGRFAAVGFPGGVKVRFSEEGIVGAR